MSAEGFGCLYLPSIAPQSANLNALGTQDNATLGGIGSGAHTSPHLNLHVGRLRALPNQTIDHQSIVE